MNESDGVIIPRPFFVILVAIFFAAVFLVSSNSAEGIALAISVLSGVLSLRFSMVVPVFFIISTLLVPNEILPVLAGTQEMYGFGFIKIHPASLAVFIASFLCVISRRKLLFETIKGSKLLSIVIIMFAGVIISMLLQTFVFRGLKGVPQCLENYIFPFCFFLYLLTVEDKQFALILKAFVFLIVVIAIYSIFEYSYKKNPLYDSLYLKSGFNLRLFTYINEYRITTSLGHPLKNTLYFLFAIPLSLFLFKKPLNLISTVLLTIAVFLTGSRIAALIAVVSIIAYYTNITLDLRKHFKNIVITILLITAVFFCLFYTPIGDTLIYRFIQDKESVVVRMEALSYAGEILRENLIFGKGMGTSFDISVSLFNKSVSFENPWLMLINDVGLPTAMLYFTILLMVALISIKKLKSTGRSRAVFISFMSVIIMMSSFSSFGIRNTIDMLVWFIIALLFRYDDAAPQFKPGESR